VPEPGPYGALVLALLQECGQDMNGRPLVDEREAALAAAGVEVDGELEICRLLFAERNAVVAEVRREKEDE